MRKVFFKIVLMIFLLSTLFLSCAKQKESKKKQLHFGAMSSMDYLPFLVAKEAGVCDSLGLNLKIVKFFSANDRDAAFQSGTIDGTVIDYTGAILQQANGIPLHLIMKTDGDFELIASRWSGINSLAQLEGKSIAVSRNTVIEYTVDRILATVGISDLMVHKPEINKIPLRFEMLETGKIDASVFPNPFALMARQQAHKKLASTKEMGLSITGVMFSEKAIKEKSEAIELLLKAYNIAVERMQTGSFTRQRIDKLLVEELGFVETQLADFPLPQYQSAALPKLEDLDDAASWLKSKNLIPSGFDVEQLLDVKFIATFHK